ncbi:MAG: molybdopterin molybdotransferase MoeA [Intrasporangium sp.]|uniref:molybdopterin molybdotransferase MoeA n=1 Tax=Intrasporangium sp. TaxID=1925024 RepID=UPI002647ECE7|nr:gephyrin-like molybdotransferase Glp [Intrasporangium sp.]MDN5795618.1 molybdopterin molybdotransferase MoeA [Intrasporangium sp.]
MGHVSVVEHRAALRRVVGPGRAERLPLDRHAVGRRLTADLIAADDLPRFDSSAMDGYAAHPAHGGRRVLDVVGDVPAGAAADFVVRPGQAARIMTGARVPEGAVAVVPVERTDASPTGPPPTTVTVRGDLTPGRHIRRRGEDIASGETVAPAGTLVDAALLALARSTGCTVLTAHAPTRVAVIATGAELAGPEHDPAAGEIHESNSDMIAALALEAGCLVTHVDKCSDDPAELAALFTALDVAADVDLVITTGGVSQGAYEVVRQVGTSFGGFEFVHLAMQPGGPQGTGRLAARTPVVCLPGTPVGAYVSFAMLLRPALDERHGNPPRQPGCATYVGAERGTRPGRVQFVSAILAGDGTVSAAPGHHLRALTRADALIEVPEQVERLCAGDEVVVHRL